MWPQQCSLWPYSAISDGAWPPNHGGLAWERGRPARFPSAQDGRAPRGEAQLNPRREASVAYCVCKMSIAGTPQGFDTYLAGSAMGFDTADLQDAKALLEELGG